MVYFEVDTGFSIANVVLTGIVLVPLLVLCIQARARARRGGDPVRGGVLWVKAACPLLFLSILVTVVCDALFLYIAYAQEADRSNSDLRNRLFWASVLLEYANTYVEQLADCAALLALVLLGLGLRRVLRLQPAEEEGTDLDGGGGGGVSSSAPGRVLWLLAGVVVAVLFVLATACFGVSVRAFSDYYPVVFRGPSFSGDSDRDSDETAADLLVQRIRIIHDLRAAFEILGLVAAVALLVSGSVLARKARSTVFHKTAVLFLVATVLWLVRFLWHVVYVATWDLASYQGGRKVAVYVVDPLLNVWTFLAVLALLCGLCAPSDDAGGLWSASASSSQPWPGAPANPAGYAAVPASGYYAQQPAYYGYGQAYATPPLAEAPAAPLLAKPHERPVR